MRKTVPAGTASAAAPLHSELPNVLGGVPTNAIPRRSFQRDLPLGTFAREFASTSTPCIIEGLVDDWPAHSGGESRAWRLGRWERLARAAGDTMMLDCGFDPSDKRMMHFGDDDFTVLFNPGRLQMPAWVFWEVGRLREAIMAAQSEVVDSGVGVDCSETVRPTAVDWRCHPELLARLDHEVEVRNMPFVAVDKEASYLRHFAPIRCRIRDLVPLAFYLSHDTSALPEEMRQDIRPQAAKLIQEWGSPYASRLWVTTGAPWRLPYPPWSSKSVPLPYDDNSGICSCFHCDRMENLHSVLTGEKQVVLVAPGCRDVLRATKHAKQRQWLMVPINAPGSASYLGATTFTSELQQECTSSQSAVHPLQSPESNRRVTGGAWPDEVDEPVWIGRLRPGDTLYIPAYWWHWVETATPITVGQTEGGAVAMSVNFWYWPAHNDEAMARWCYQGDVESYTNARVPVSPGKKPPTFETHFAKFRRETEEMRQHVGQQRPWPASGSRGEVPTPLPLASRNYSTVEELSPPASSDVAAAADSYGCVSSTKVLITDDLEAHVDEDFEAVD
eukprot:TRINITY_DN75864_c0_g1_i1.p1 TRINITY_DN75864_c0_g1~~TRINITY_DN75864_c0_g1_i1.p1  ORF type:complete len:559 (-),score=86.11 TRINITY_DN75864_c0_g1_i1:62-1738(-)